MIEPGIYLLIDNHEVVYIGQTLNIHQRLKSHKDKIFDRYHFFRCEIDKLNFFEEELIDRFRPKYNKSKLGRIAINIRILQLKREISRLKRDLILEDCKK